MPDGGMVNKKGAPIYLSIRNFVAEGGSNFKFDLQVDAPGIDSMAICNPTSGRTFARVDLFGTSSRTLRGLRVTSPRPLLIFERSKEKSHFIDQAGTLAYEIVARKEIAAELDLRSRPVRILNANAVVEIRS